MTLQAQAMASALNRSTVAAQGMGGYMVVNTRSMEQAAAASARLGHNLNTTTVQAAALAASLQRVSVVARDGRLLPGVRPGPGTTRRCRKSGRDQPQRLVGRRSQARQRGAADFDGQHQAAHVRVH